MSVGDVVAAVAKAITTLRDVSLEPAVRVARCGPQAEPGGPETHGSWVDSSGNTRHLTSGRDADSETAWQQLQAAGLSCDRRPVVTDHVEMKMAARMVKQRLRHIELVINNRPCVRLLGCDRLLPVILPTGYSITVHGPNYRKTFMAERSGRARDLVRPGTGERFRRG
ncbi:DddA-like double-stranded DNA deaminase toxin [Amycolatopsis sp. NPDC004368]